MKHIIIFLVVVSMMILGLGASYQDLTVTVTPEIVAISITPSAPYDFGAQPESATPSTATNYWTVDNTSTVQTDQTISVQSATWEGGAYDWSHAEDGVPGSEIVGLKANKGGTWGVGDVIVKNASPNYIAENQPANTDYDFGLKMWVPTAFNGSDTGTEKTNTVRVSAASG